MFMAGVICEPLFDYNYVHVSEESHQKHDLRNELEEEVQPSLVVDGVSTLLENGKRHMSDSKDYCHLHFERVCEGNMLVR